MKAKGVWFLDNVENNTAPEYPTGAYGEVTKILFCLDIFTSHFLSLSAELNPNY